MEAIEDRTSPGPIREVDIHEDWSDSSPRMAPKMPVKSKTRSIDSSIHGRGQDVDRRMEKPEGEPEMLLQPKTRPISHDQLMQEVKGIYAGLVMVEAECIDIDEKQTAAVQEKDLLKKVQLKNDQWQSLIALHKQLLHEHHDFFLASQHPAASPALSRLAAKYSMPARMWRHGIHAFLEVLRYRLPDSLEHMLAFIYIAYSMMALLYETVPTFEDTWIECLGDLGRYRMAIEDDEPRDRETWTNVARFWYNKAADKNPTVGRLYHHLAILARPYSLEQLSLYTRALTCVTPFESARESVMTLFKPILKRTDAVNRRSSSLDTVFIKAHGYLFTLQGTDAGANIRFSATVHELQKDGLFVKYISKSGSKFKEAGVQELEKDDLYDKYISKSGLKFKGAGAYCADANIAALFEYETPKQGRSEANLRLVYEDARRIREEVTRAHGDLFTMHHAEDDLDAVNSRSSSLVTVFMRAHGYLLYTRAFTCATPFKSARGSLSTLFSPLLSARHTTGPQPSPLKSASNTANTATQDESSTEHQLTNTFAALLRSALDQISHWRVRLTSFGKALGSFRLSSVGAAYKIRIPTCTLFIVPATARTIPRNAGNEEPTGSLTAAMIPLAHWPYLAFVIITLLGAQHLAHMKDPIFVWGCMMTIWAFGWWTIRADSNTSLQISGV